MLDSSNLPLAIDSSFNSCLDPQIPTISLMAGVNPQQLVFIDARIGEASIIADKFHNAQIIRLDANVDGVAQITKVLGKYQDIASIHIFSHGSDGDIQLGNSHLNLASLPTYRENLTQWGNALSNDADLLFYGCNVGAGADGSALVQQISQITRADIAASNNLTGNTTLGGDWNLEVQIGKIEAKIEKITGFQGILPIYNGKEYLLSSAKSWEDAQVEAKSVGGNLVTINNAAEETWLQQNFGTSEQLWIGLTDRNTEGMFEWVNGETATYRNWSPGEPNDYKFEGAFPGGEDYAAMNQGTQWNDLPNNYGGIYRGIIERNIDFTYDGKKYQLTSSAKSWEDAQVEAKSVGGNLVTINNTAEETWLKQTFGTNQKLWIGLTDRTTEGKFEWVNGETATYRNWSPGEPNDYKFSGAFPGGEDYAVMNQGTQWNDLPNNYGGIYRGIVEIGGTTTKPGTIGLETSTYQIDETGSTVNVAVLRKDGSDGTVTVDYRTVDASAKAGSDYQAVSGRVTFAPGETRKSIAIPIVDDNLAEENEQFNLTIDNVLGGATLLAPRTATITIKDDETPTPLVAFQNFASTNALTLNGKATQAGDRLRLTDDILNQASTAFLNQPLAIDNNTSFSTKFQFQISGSQGSNGVDGFTFMLQNTPVGANKALGKAAGYLGYSDISKSLAIEFDTYQNPWDAGNNQISVLRDGVVDKSLISVNAPFDLNSGAPLTAWIDYDGGTNNLSVFLSNTASKPGAAVLSYNVDLPTVVGSQAFLGFSAGTGGLSNIHEILNWSLTSNSNLLTAPTPIPVIQKQTIISNLSQPIAIDWAPDGSKMFIAQKDGIIKVLENGQLKTTPFIDLRNVVNSARDRGLLDIAVHPDFFNGKPYIYAFYTFDPAQVSQNSGLAGVDGEGNRANRLTRITADSATNYTTAIAGSEVVILGKNSTWNNFNAFANSTVNFNEKPAGILADGTNLQDFINQDSESHVGGSLQFAPDGSLYVSIGDGTSYNQIDPRTVRVQDIDNLSGKILRIDPITGAGLADNPFYNGNQAANRSKVYQSGLRNPFRTAVDPRNGQLYIGDVGWTQWEEINAGGAGANFGWPYYEGGNGVSLRTGSYQDLPAAKAFYASGKQVIPSVAALNHGTDGINAIVLGDVYTGNQLPSKYQGNLFFNDLGQGIVRNAKLDAAGKIGSIETFATDAQYVVQITQGPDGNLYYVDLDDGVVGRWQVA